MNNAQIPTFSKFKVFGLLFIGISAIGFSPILVKIATDSSALLVASARTVFAFLFLVPVHFALKKKELPRQVPRKEQIMVAVSGVLLGLHFIAWISSIYFTSIASASVLVTIHPILLIVIERFAFKRKFEVTVWLGVLVAFSGSLLIGYADHDGDTAFSNPLLGNSLAALAAFIFAGYFLIGNRVRQNRDWFHYVFPVYGYAALTCVLALFIVEGFSIEITGLVLLVGLGMAIGPQILGHGSLNYAVKYISPTLLSTLILFEPAVSATMAYFFFGEVPLGLSFAGMMIVLVGIALTWARSGNQS